MKAMQARRVDEVLLGLGSLFILTDERDETTVTGQGVSIRRPPSFPAIGLYFSTNSSSHLPRTPKVRRRSNKGPRRRRTGVL